MSEETFTTARDFLYNYRTKYGNTISRRPAYAIYDDFYGLKAPYIESIRPELKSQTLEKVNSAIKVHLQYDNYYPVMITNDAAGMKAKLLSGEPA